jgi:3-deoxy-D-manno-octulosonic acid kinase
MFENIPIPSSFSLVQKGKVFLLLKEEYKDLLLEQGIEDTESFLKKHSQTSTYLRGRSFHPSIPLKDGKRIVIRHYLHGGLFSAFTRDLYFFGSRSFQELALTEEILSCNIPTLQLVGAIHRMIFPHFYKAYLLSLEVPQAVDLIQYFQAIGSHPSPEKLFVKRKTVHSAGLLLRQFHDAGFFHADLQLRNILVSGDRVLLIDFDHSYRKPRLSYRERLKNLLRLNRSAEKWKCHGLPITWTNRLHFFQAYAGEDEKMRVEMRKVFRTYQKRFFIYRLGWTLDRLFSKNK